jgi:hypothetical protein
LVAVRMLEAGRGPSYLPCPASVSVLGSPPKSAHLSSLDIILNRDRSINWRHRDSNIAQGTYIVLLSIRAKADPERRATLKAGERGTESRRWAAVSGACSSHLTSCPHCENPKNSQSRTSTIPFLKLRSLTYLGHPSPKETIFKADRAVAQGRVSPWRAILILVLAAARMLAVNKSKVLGATAAVRVNVMV